MSFREDCTRAIARVNELFIEAWSLTRRIYRLWAWALRRAAGNENPFGKTAIYQTFFKYASPAICTSLLQRDIRILMSFASSAIDLVQTP